jgi:very-short-patch-repair endonuclease
MNKTEEFIRKARLKHGDKYDYSKVEYVNYREKVIIICKTHGEYQQTPDSHLQGSGCLLCSNIASSKRQRSNTDEFIMKSKKIHGDKYDYSKVDYKGSKEKIIFICKTHGEFLQSHIKHCCGQGCVKCAVIQTANKQRGNIDEFLEKSKKIHGDKYDYSKVEYNGRHNKITIICKTHGEFIQELGSHLQGSGCNKCACISSSNKQRSNTDEFLEKSKKIHGDKYEYSKVEYNDNTTPVIIICKEHGEFLQSPAGHLRGCGCRKCANKLIGDMVKSNTDEFIEKSIQIHGDKYDYSKVEYVINTTPVIIICKEHGEFLQIPAGHVSGRGCNNCAHISRSDKMRSNTDEFLEKAIQIHGYTYNYSKVGYVNNTTPVIIICKEHGEFLQSPAGHLCGCGCQHCGYISNSNKQRSNTEEFIEKAIKIHGDKYDYSITEYIRAHNPVKIICKKHGEFKQAPANHTNSGFGCPLCVNKTEGILCKKLKVIYPTIVTQFKQEWCKKTKYLPYDFCIPEHNIIIELDGRQHFQQVRHWQSPEEQLENDKFKEQCANDNNYSMIRLLQEDVFYDKYDWCKELCDAIEEIKHGDDVVNVYLCKNGEYDNF